MSAKRPATLIVAIVLLVVFSLANYIPFSIPEGAEGPPQFIMYAGYVLGVLGLIAAFGLWQRMTWGLILALVVVVLGALAALPGIFEAPTAVLRVLCVVAVAVGALIVVLLLLPSSRRAPV
jgi:hypothetical protein